MIVAGALALALAGTPDAAPPPPAVAAAAGVTLAGAPPATDPSPSPSPSADGAATAPELLRDPWVKLNTSIFKADVGLDHALFRPVSLGYRHLFPAPVRDHLGLALTNMDEPVTAINDLLQVHVGRMGKTVARIVINSTIGLGGLFDVAAKHGMARRDADFGQTLARYGVRPGPYVMLPVLGPSDVRDAFGRLADNLMDPVSLFVGGITSNFGIARVGADGINWRSSNDSAMQSVYGATDPYATARSIYSQNRQAAVQDATGRAAALPDFDAAPASQ